MEIENGAALVEKWIVLLQHKRDAFRRVDRIEEQLFDGETAAEFNQLMLIAQKTRGDFADLNAPVRMPEKLHGKFPVLLSGKTDHLFQDTFCILVYMIHQAGRIHVAAADRNGVRFTWAFLPVGDSQDENLSVVYPCHQIKFISRVVLFKQYFLCFRAGTDFVESAADLLQAVQYEDAAGTVSVQRLGYHRETEIAKKVRGAVCSGLHVPRRRNIQGSKHFFHHRFVPVEFQLLRNQIAGQTGLCRDFDHTFQEQIGKCSEDAVHPFLPADFRNFFRGSDIHIVDDIRLFFCRTVWIAVADNRTDSSCFGEFYQLYKFLGAAEDENAMIHKFLPHNRRTAAATLSMSDVV